MQPATAARLTKHRSRASHLTVNSVSANSLSCTQQPPMCPIADGTHGAVSRKHFRADSPVFLDLNHGHLTLAIIMA